jgi:Subtilase family/Dockerin type I domain
MFRPRGIFFSALFLTSLVITQLSLGARPEPAKDAGLVLQKRAVPVKPMSTQIAPEARMSRVIVKFKEGSQVRLRGSQFVAKEGFSIKEAETLLKPYINGRLNRLFGKSEQELDKAKEIYEASSRHQLADLNLYYKIDVAGNAEAERIINQLNRLDIVEIAYFEPVPEPADYKDVSATPNFEPYQDYLQIAPYGVDAYYAKTQPGGDGTGVKIVDIEYGWNMTHEDLGRALGKLIVGDPSRKDDHGTAVLGEMIATDNGFGVTGIAPGADVGMVSVEALSVSEALLTAVDNLNRGDLILIELHSPGPHYNFQVRPDQAGYVCMEYWQDNFDAIQYAWARGIIVVEAAGNGSENYDDLNIYGQLFDTTYRNSHAILAGAGAPPSGVYGTDRSRLGFSNYGARVNLQGYGNGVYTTGYGGLYNGGGDTNQFYTATFSGTSSASPIVTASIACLQGYYKANFGSVLTSDMVRTVMVATGSPQQGNTSQHIGPRPDLAGAIPNLTPPPSLYTEPIYIDTTVAHGNNLNIPIWLHNRSITYGLDYSLIGDDSLARAPIGNWLEVAPSSGTINAADSVPVTVTLDGSVIPSTMGQYKGIIDISWSQSGQTLDSIAYIPVFLRVPCTPDTTFKISASGEPQGPIYNWIDAKSMGTVIPQNSFYNNYASTPLDDGSAGPYNLPFAFQFYDSTYLKYYVGVNGAISFTDADVNSNGFYDENLHIPGNPFTTFVSPFWNDLTLDPLHGGHGDIYIYESPTHDSTVIEWYRVGNFNSVSDTLTTFEIILTKWGDITFQYQSVGNTGLNNSALIGLNRVDCQSTPYCDSGTPTEHIVDNLKAVRFDQPIMFMAGDANASGLINIADVTYLINFLYKSGLPPKPPASGDVNCNGLTNISDITYLINYLYKSGPDPCYFIM